MTKSSNVQHHDFPTDGQPYVIEQDLYRQVLATSHCTPPQ